MEVSRFPTNQKICKTPQIYFLPKIHKGKLPPPGRPIVLGNNCPSEKISTYVDMFLQPLVKTIPSYVKDTGEFAETIKKISNLEKGDIIGSLDVTSLYTNIPNDEGTKLVEQILKDKERSHTET